jgi:hypothetical protein
MPNEVYSADTQTQTKTAVPNAGVDNHIDIKGSAANWNAITSTSFLPDTKPGTDQELIRSGDQTTKVASGQQMAEVQKKLWHHVYDAEGQDGVLEFDQSRQTTVIKSDTLRIGIDQNVIVSNDQMVSITNKRKINAREINEYGKERIIIQAGVELILQGPGGSIKIDSTGVTIQGVLVKIN